MSKLNDFRLLSFDVYGALIDWESGVVDALQPILKANKKTDVEPKTIIKHCQDTISPQAKEHPEMLYSTVLTTIHPKVCKLLDCAQPSEEESKAFGDSVGNWPAFPDSVEALKRLQKYYKLVVLSNVDNESFSASRDGGLQGFQFDAVFTAQDIGSYKPDLRNFEYMFKQVKERFGIERDQVLQTAQSQFHDHHPAKEIGLKSSWIYRSNSILGNREDPVWNWKFDTLAEMADAVEKAFDQ